MSTLSNEEKMKICQYLKGRHIPSGLGTAEEACSVAAINLALTGRLTDEIPECMDIAVGCWIIGVQDAMPDAMRNSPEWRRLLPHAAGTGRVHEAARLGIIRDWMFDSLALIQPAADKHGFGAEWRRMTSERTAASAIRAAHAPRALASAPAAAHAAHAAHAAAYATAAGAAAAYAAHAAAYATNAYATRARAATRVRADFWERADPAGCLRRLIEVSEIIPDEPMCGE